jgi:hypothetical protein
MGDAKSSTLWIASPDVSETFPSSRAAALTALVAARHSEVPLISHFCERPRPTELCPGRDVEKVGLIGLIYSLIAQLLQFNVTNDSFRISEAQLLKLDGSDDSWSVAVEVFSYLWETTTKLSYCIIDGPNDLSFSGGTEWCDDLLGVILKDRKSGPPVRILLTTTGQSRVLPDHVPVDAQIFAVRGAREGMRNGPWVAH